MVVRGIGIVRVVCCMVVRMIVRGSSHGVVVAQRHAQHRLSSSEALQRHGERQRKDHQKPWKCPSHRCGILRRVTIFCHRGNVKRCILGTSFGRA